MLGNQDPSSLIDYVTSYQVIQEMQIIPINRQLVIQVAVLAAAPLLLVWIFWTPVEQIIAGLFKLVL